MLRVLCSLFLPLSLLLISIKQSSPEKLKLQIPLDFFPFPFSFTFSCSPTSSLPFPFLARRVSDPLGLELQAVVSLKTLVLGPELSPLVDQQVLLTAEPPLQPQCDFDSNICVLFEYKLPLFLEFSFICICVKKHTQHPKTLEGNSSYL